MNKKIVYILIFVFMISAVSSSFQIGNASHKIDFSYGPEEFVRGWINISLDKEPVNSVFSSSLGENINIIELINKSSGFSKTCVPVDCSVELSSENGETSKSYILGSMDSKIFGIKFEGKIVGINYINFTIQSNAPASCENQLEIDFLNDGSVDLGNTKSMPVGCSSSKSYGCFNFSKTPTLIAVDSFPKKHCQKIKLTKSPGFKVGAWVKKEFGNKNLTIALYDKSRDAIEGANCKLPDAPATGGEIYCNINFLNSKEKDYYVCIYQESEGTGLYKIRGYEDSVGGCGFYGDQNEIASYQISAEGLRYNTIGTLEISDDFPEGDTLGNMAKNYIWKKYKSYDCSGGCLVPIKLISQASQTVLVQNLKIKYETNLGPGIESDKFYDVNEIPAVVSANFQQLSLNNNFKIPKNYGNITFQLKLNNESIFSEKIFVERVPIIEYLYPTTTVAGMPTDFRVISNSNGNITDYFWEFGDSGTQRTTINSATHTYNNTGNFSLKITLTDKNKFSSYKNFDIIVGTPKDVANKTLSEMQTRLIKLKSQIAGFEEFYQKGFNDILDTENINTAIKDLQRDYSQAKNEQDYIAVMKKIVVLEVPELIEEIRTAESISFLPTKEEINLDALKNVVGGNYDASEEDDYKNAVLAWNQKNMETKISFKEFSARYNNENRAFIRFFKIKSEEKETLNYDSYWIIKNLEKMTFGENYLESENSGYTNIRLKDASNTIEFYTIEDVDFSNLPLFISPEFSRLTIIKGINPDVSGKKFKWSLFVFILFIILLTAFVLYIILQLYYKNKYEKHLFGNRNELFNIIAYISNANKKGIIDKEIEGKLKKSGWNSEQISYAMKKYGGKNTGMFFEIPVEGVLAKISGWFKKKPVQKTDNKFPLNFGMRKGF